MTVQWLQRQMLGGFRAGLGADQVETALQLYEGLGRDRCLSLYERTGAFLQWPPKAVDEVLFLESIILSLFESGRVDEKQR